MRTIILLALIGIASLGCPKGSSSGRLDPRYRTLSVELLQTIPDSEVEAAIFENALHLIGENWEQEVEIVRAFPPGVRMLYATWLLEAEVNNGGFNQYFWNSSGRLASDALWGLRLVGANAHAALLERAMAVRAIEESVIAKFKEEATLEAFSESYDHTQLNPLDEEFFALDEDLSELRVAYVRAHGEEFVLP